jgi:hypothetical protein
MNMNSSIISILVALAALCSCTGSSNSTTRTDTQDTITTKVTVSRDSLDEELDRINPQFVITNNGPGQYYFAMLTGGGGKPEGQRMATLRGIRTVMFQVYTPENRMVGMAATDEIISSGVMNSETNEASLSITASIQWTAPEPLPAGSYAIMTVISAHGQIKRRHAMPFAEETVKHGSNILNMWLESRDQGPGVEFILHVERLAAAPSGEYLPSGEQYRIELESEVGETLWSSSHGMAYVQSIGAVQPAEIGKSVEHHASFDGRNQLTNTRLAPGRYRIVATIPAKPQPYILREEFTWSGQ